MDFYRGYITYDVHVSQVFSGYAYDWKQISF